MKRKHKKMSLRFYSELSCFIICLIGLIYFYFEQNLPIIYLIPIFVLTILYAIQTFLQYKIDTK